MERQCGTMEKARISDGESAHPHSPWSHLAIEEMAEGPGLHPLPPLFSPVPTPPSYFFGVTAYFDPFTLVTKIAEFWKFVVGLAVGLDKSCCLSGLRFLIYEMRCWNRWFQHIPSGLMIV